MRHGVRRGFGAGGSSVWVRRGFGAGGSSVWVRRGFGAGGSLVWVAPGLPGCDVEQGQAWAPPCKVWGQNEHDLLTPPQSYPVNHLESRNMPECRFNKSTAPLINLSLASGLRVNFAHLSSIDFSLSHTPQSHPFCPLYSGPPACNSNAQLIYGP
jgi:hypothetical protein